MPRIFATEGNKLFDGWNDGYDENYDVCQDCFETLEEGADYLETDEATFIIADMAEAGRHYDCHICNKKLTPENYN